MKKTLVAVAAMAAVTGAMADVTLSGNLNQGYTTDKTTTSSSVTTKTAGLRSASAGSFLTFAGSEDIGSGLKASFKIEAGLGLNNNSVLVGAAVDGSAAANREAWVALAGGFGSVTLGNQYTQAFLTAAAVDPNGVNNITGYGPVAIIVGANGVERPNTITYALPTLVTGLGVTVQKQSGTATSGALNASGGATNAGNGTGYGINYIMGDLMVGTSGQTDASTTAGAASNKLTVNSISYDLHMVKLAYTGLKNTTSANVVSKGNFYAVSAPFGAVSVNYTAGTNTVANVNTKYSQAGAFYTLSKRTQAYALMGSNKAAVGTAKESVTSFGLNHSF